MNRIRAHILFHEESPYKEGAAKIHGFCKKNVPPSTKTFLTFSRFKYQNFLKSFLAKISEFQCLVHAH